jgi:hypothetical protein
MYRSKSRSRHGDLAKVWLYQVLHLTFCILPHNRNITSLHCVLAEMQDHQPQRPSFSSQHETMLDRIAAETLAAETRARRQFLLVTLLKEQAQQQLLNQVAGIGAVDRFSHHAPLTPDYLRQPLARGWNHMSIQNSMAMQMLSQFSDNFDYGSHQPTDDESSHMDHQLRNIGPSFSDDARFPSQTKRQTSQDASIERRQKSAKRPRQSCQDPLLMLAKASSETDNETNKHTKPIAFSAEISAAPYSALVLDAHFRQTPGHCNVSINWYTNILTWEVTPYH